MKNITSSIDTNVLPNMYNKIRADITQFYEKNKDKKEQQLTVQFNHSQRGKIYFFKQYVIDLWGWSGLQKWYDNLINRKHLNNEINLFKNIYLDPTLCLRRIQDSQGRQLMQQAYWNSNKIQLDKNNLMKASVIICQKIPENNYAMYQQKEILMSIKWTNDFKELKKSLIHQFVHMLDHFTAVTMEYNLDQLQKYIDINTKELNDGENYNQVYTIDEQHNIDPDNLLQQQYAPKLNQVFQQMQQLIDDAVWGFHNHYIENPQLLLYFTYLFEYNFKLNKKISRTEIQNKLKEQKLNKILDAIKYLSKLSNHNNLFKYLNHMNNMSNSSYVNTMKQIYNRFKQLYLYNTEISDKII